MRIASYCLAALSLTVSPLLADRDSPFPDWEEGHLTFYLDNDLFAGSDANYTNGARLSWISTDRDPSDIGSVQRLLTKLSGSEDSMALFQYLSGFSDPSSVKYQFGFALTQLMFTPQDRKALSPPPGQRPYAGWLGLGFSLHTKDAHALSSVELTLGLVGPHAFAEETQDFVHTAQGIGVFHGWDSQIPNEPTLNLHFTQRRRLRFLETQELTPWSMDGNLEMGTALGTFRTASHIGLLIRSGWNLPVDFSDPRLSPTSNTQRLFDTDSSDDGRWSLYSIAGARASLVFHDITLDGPVFREFDTGIDKKRLVGELYAGFGVRYDDWEFSYMHTFRSKEFNGQSGGTQFGSIALRYRF